MTRSGRVPAYAGGVGLTLLVAGIALTWWGVTGNHPEGSVPGILLAVLGLVALRVRAWGRKERVLRQVGHDLHVPPED